ncbi:MAG: hypothetical protein RL358_917 [Pseudomonadota bacterium]
MRTLTFLLLTSLSLNVLAAQPVPADLQPLPAAPTAYDASNDTDEAEVTITKQRTQMIEEYRAGNRLYMIKITPKIGAPYYLLDDRGDGKFARQESLDSGFRPPQWVIKRF